MDRELEALQKARGHVADIATLAEMAREYLREGRFEDAAACLRLIEQHAALAGRVSGASWGGLEGRAEPEGTNRGLLPATTPGGP